MSTPAVIPCIEPRYIRSGDTLQWQRSECNYPPSDGWSLNYNFVNAASQFAIATTSPDGVSFAVNVPAATTAGYAVGEYRWAAQVSDGNGNKFTVGEGTAIVLPNIASATGATDVRSPDEKMLDAITALLQNRATADVDEYEIHGRRLKKMQIRDLEYWRGVYESRVKAERRRRGERVQPTRVAVHFGGRRWR